MLSTPAPTFGLFYTILMATAAATGSITVPVYVRSRRRVVPAAVPRVNFPAAMLPLAFFIDMIQLVAAAILFGLAAIPYIGLLFAFTGGLVNVLVTTVIFIGFRFWLYQNGFNQKIILAIFLAVLIEFFTSGLMLTWTFFVLRMRYIAKLQNKASDVVNKANAVLAA